MLDRIYFTSDDGFQNKIVYQPTFNRIKYKNTSTEYIIGWESKGLFNSKLVVLSNNFLPNIKYFEKKVGIQFNNTPSVLEKIVTQQKL